MINYEGRKKTVGERIETERTEKGWSRKELLPKIYKSIESHKTLTAWESGKRLPDLDSLARMAELFECDVGYLIGDYDERTRDGTDIAKASGLDKAAADKLVAMKDDESAILSLNTLFTSDSFLEMLHLLQTLRMEESSKRAYKKFSEIGVGRAEKKEIEKIDNCDLLRYRLQRLLDRIMDDIEQERDYYGVMRKEHPMFSLKMLSDDLEGGQNNAAKE